MAYYRRNNYTRRYGRRTNYRRNNRSNIRNYRAVNKSGGVWTQFDWKKIAAQAAKGALAYAVTNSELKFYDETNNLSPGTTGSIASYIRGITQGDTGSSIDGNSIRIKQFVMNSAISMSGLATSTRVKYWIIADFDPQVSGVPAWTDVFTTTGLTPLMNLTSYPNRFKILKTKMFSFSLNSYSETVDKVYLNLDQKVKFDTSQNPRTYDLLVMAISDEATNLPSFNVQSRIRFYDN